MLLWMHGDAAYRRFIGKSPARPDARPSLAVVLAAHDALTDGPDNNGYVSHISSQYDWNDWNGLTDWNVFILDVDPMHILSPRSRRRPRRKDPVEPR